jgi:uncharacterized protein involved in exopolysaccharide biosynthesis
VASFFGGEGDYKVSRGFGFDSDVQAEIPLGYVEERIGLSDLQAIIRRRHVTFSITFLFVLVAIAGFVFLAPQIYSAKSVVMVPSLFQYDDPSTIPTRVNAEDDVRISTTVELLKSPKVAEQLALVLAQELVHEDTAPKPHSGDQSKAPEASRGEHDSTDPQSSAPATGGKKPSLAEISKQIKSEDGSLRAATKKIQNQTFVRRVEGSRLIEITATARNADLAVRIANGLPEVYGEMRRQEQRRDRQKKIERLEAQIKKAEASVYGANIAVAKYMRDNNMLGPDAAQAVQSRVSALEMALANTAAEGASRRLNQLLDEQKAMQSRLSELAVTYGPGYPEIVGMQQRLASLEAEIAVERSQVGETAQVRRDQVDATAAALSQEVRAMRRKHFDDLEANAGLQKLEREATAAADVMDLLLDKLTRAKNEIGGDVLPIEMVTRAIEQDRADAGDILKKLGVGVLGAWFLAILAALAAEGLDNKVRSADQVRAFLRAPTLAMVPKVNPRKLGPNTLQAYLEKNPSSEFAESIRNLYLELMSRGPAERQRVVVITSVRPGDGKSTIANGLAAIAEAFSVSAKVMEFDRRFEFGPARMKSGVELDASARPTGSPDASDREGSRDNLPVQRSKVRPIDDATWSGESAPMLPAQLSDLKDRWGLVIIEAAPILKSRDAKALAATATDVILVLEWGGVSPGALRAIRKAFGRVEVSAVINRVNMKAHARRAYGDTIDFAAKYA